MSFASEELADRIREILGPRVPVTEQKMFGGRAFMLNGHMLVAPLKDGGLLVRVGNDAQAAAIEQFGAEPMRMGERTMGGFVMVSGDLIEDEESLAQWIGRARAFVDALPAK